MGARPRVCALLLVLGFCLPGVPATAQSEPFLLDLEGSRVAVRYTPGSLDRAARLQFRFDEIAEAVTRWSKTPAHLVVYLLSGEQWNSAELGLPYGLPERMPQAGLALPAWGDEATVALWQGLFGSLPETDPEPLRGTTAQAATLELTDMLGEVEAARILLEEAGLLGDRAWISDLLAHAVVRSTKRGDLARAARADEFYRGLLGRAGASRRALSEYRSGIDLSEWLWFQASIREGAKVVGETAGADAAKALLKLARKKGGRIGEAELFDRFPELRDWQRRSFGAEDSLARLARPLTESATPGHESAWPGHAGHPDREERRLE